MTVYITLHRRTDYQPQRFCKEVITWKALHHQNVLPLLGVTMTNNQFAMASEWMINGNINGFIKSHAEADRFELVGAWLLLRTWIR